MALRQVISHTYGDLAYRVFGNGPEIAIAFHGFGQDATIYRSAVSHLENYTIYSFDLFYHGSSTWFVDDRSLVHKTWSAYFQLFLDKHQIQSFKLIGFSIGSRLALSLLVAFPAKISSIVLIAPEAVAVSSLYTLATSHAIPRFIFSMILQNDQFLKLVVGFAQRTGLIDRTTDHFIKTELSTAVRRGRIYRTWMIFRKMTFDGAQLARIINDLGIPVKIISAQKDFFLNLDKARRFYEQLEDADWISLDVPHQQLLNVSFKYLDKCER